MFNLAFAQSGAAAEGPGPLVQFAPLILIFVVFYFLLIRPQQQKAKAHRNMLDNLKRNDQIVTAGGLYGRIIELGEKVVTLEIAQNVQIRVERSKIETTTGETTENKKPINDKRSGKDK